MSEVVKEKSQEAQGRLRRVGRNVLGTISGLAVFGAITYGGYKVGENVFAPLSPGRSESSSIMGGLLIGSITGLGFGLTTWAVVSGDRPSVNPRPKRTESTTPPPETSEPTPAQLVPTEPEAVEAEQQATQEVAPAPQEQLPPAASAESVA